MGLVGQVQAVIHELVHLVSGAKDVFLAEKISGGQWMAPKGKDDDPEVIRNAAEIWHAKLAEKCK